MSRHMGALAAIGVEFISGAPSASAAVEASGCATVATERARTAVQRLGIGLVAAALAGLSGHGAYAGNLVPGGWLAAPKVEAPAAEPPEPIVPQSQPAIRPAPDRPSVPHPVRRQHQVAPPQRSNDGRVQF
jgi:hypothetical protein